MRIRRNIMVDSMFRDIASREELQTVDRLYSEGRKGSAIVYQLRRIREKWVELLGNSHEKKKEIDLTGFDIPKLI